ncbi:ATP-binding cassette domain-containing protein [Sandaracinobacteroides sp. A072]|uniref:ATP-binding cassette domain-containing protein n=1 Tax=Sandaracinobacteroides sp. A072 TaxID=3461146 RepID=UPI0040422C2D
MAWGVLLLILSGVARAAAQGLAADAGLGAALAAKDGWRTRLLPGLVASRLTRDRLSGEAVAAAVESVEALEGYHARYRPLRVAAVGGPLLVAALTALASPVAAAILVATLVPFGFGMALAGTAARAAADRQLGAIARLNGLFLDRLRSLDEIRHFGAGDRIARQMATAGDEVATRTLAVLRVAFVSGGLIEFFAAIAVALVAVYCGFSLLGLLPFPAPETMTLGEAFFALAMAAEFYLPLRRLAAAYHDRQTGEAAEAVVGALPQAPPALPAGDRFSGLGVQGLVVRYPDGPEIGPASLALGETGLVALTGPTGSGKSTLLAAIGGLRKADAGRIDWAAGVAPAIAWSGQRPLILAGTLGENIALAAPCAGEADIRAAAIAAGLGPVLESRPGGLAAPIDWRGAGLSGGERRRIGLARALLSGRPLLLLDEPTADLDRETADALIATIGSIARDRAVIVATHDEALARAAGLRVAL